MSEKNRIVQEAKKLTATPRVWPIEYFTVKRARSDARMAATAGAPERAARFGRGARAARRRLGWTLPGCRQDRGAVVPEAGTGARHRCVQRRHERRCGGRRVAGSVDRALTRLALGVPRDGRARHDLAWPVVGFLPRPGPAAPPLERRAGLDPRRPARGGGPHVMAQLARSPPDLGVHRGQGDDRSGVALLSVLAPQVPRRA